MDFYHWPPSTKWGLPSFDIKSLQVLTYIKLSGADVNLHPIKRSWLAKEGKVLPCLHSPDGSIENPDEMIKYLKQRGYDLDSKVKKGHTANSIVPFSAFINNKLLPGVLWNLWIDNANFKDIVHSLYARGCVYPLNFKVPNSMQKAVESYVKEIKFLTDWEGENDEENVASKLHSEAISSLNILSEYLGEKEYIFGDDPSTVDSLIISVLAPVLKIGLPSCKLQNHLKGCINLCAYLNRNMRKCFGDAPLANQIQEVDWKARILQSIFGVHEPTSDDTENNDPESLNWKYDVILPVGVATLAMLSYAANAGLLTNSS